MVLLEINNLHQMQEIKLQQQNMLKEHKSLSKLFLQYHEYVLQLKKDIQEKGAVEHFINGKQDFLRESPALASYNKLMKTH